MAFLVSQNRCLSQNSTNILASSKVLRIVYPVFVGRVNPGLRNCKNSNHLTELWLLIFHSALKSNNVFCNDSKLSANTLLMIRS